MPAGVMFPSVKVSRTAHKKHGSGNANRGAKSRPILADVKSMISGSLADPKIRHNMTEHQEYCSGDGPKAEDNVLGVMISSGTDPGIREGFLVVKVLRQVVADDDGGGARCECDQGEQGCGELA